MCAAVTAQGSRALGSRRLINTTANADWRPHRCPPRPATGRQQSMPTALPGAEAAVYAAWTPCKLRQSRCVKREPALLAAAKARLSAVTRAMQRTQSHRYALLFVWNAWTAAATCVAGGCARLTVHTSARGPCGRAHGRLRHARQALTPGTTVRTYRAGLGEKVARCRWHLGTLASRLALLSISPPQAPARRAPTVYGRPAHYTYICIGLLEYCGGCRAAKTPGRDQGLPSDTMRSARLPADTFATRGRARSRDICVGKDARVAQSGRRSGMAAAAGSCGGGLAVGGAVA